MIDVNNGGKPDIIVANFDSNNIGVRFNTGNGTFTTQTTYSTDPCPFSVAVADINRDSKPDLMVTNYDGNSPGRAILHKIMMQDLLCFEILYDQV